MRIVALWDDRQQRDDFLNRIEQSRLEAGIREARLYCRGSVRWCTRRRDNQFETRRVDLFPGNDPFIPILYGAGSNCRGVGQCFLPRCSRRHCPMPPGSRVTSMAISRGGNQTIQSKLYRPAFANCRSRIFGSALKSIYTSTLHCNSDCYRTFFNNDDSFFFQIGTLDFFRRSHRLAISS